MSEYKQHVALKGDICTQGRISKAIDYIAASYADSPGSHDSDSDLDCPIPISDVSIKMEDMTKY